MEPVGDYYAKYITRHRNEDEWVLDFAAITVQVDDIGLIDFYGVPLVRYGHGPILPPVVDRKIVYRPIDATNLAELERIDTQIEREITSSARAVFSIEGHACEITSPYWAYQ